VSGLAVCPHAVGDTDDVHRGSRAPSMGLRVCECGFSQFCCRNTDEVQGTKRSTILEIFAAVIEVG